MLKLTLPELQPRYRGPMLVLGGTLYTTLTILLDRLGLMQTDGLETARYWYNMATGLTGIAIGLTMTALYFRGARRAAATSTPNAEIVERRGGEERP